MAGGGSKKKAQDPIVPDALLAAAQLPKPLGSGTKFTRIKVSTPVNEPDRDPAGATVTRTGRTVTNTEGRLLLEGLARKLGHDTATFALEYGVNEEKRQIALYPVNGKTGGAAPIRRNKARMTMTLYLKPVFMEMPELRVKAEQQCGMFLDDDTEGNECVILTLGTALNT